MTNMNIACSFGLVTVELDHVTGQYIASEFNLMRSSLADLREAVELEYQVREAQSQDEADRVSRRKSED